MTSKQDAVRAAALALQKSIQDAEAAGYHVAWPHNAAGLSGIAISETKKVKPAEEKPADKPPVFGAGRPAPEPADKPASTNKN